MFVVTFSVFCHPSAGDEKRDLELQRRLHSLNWITWEQLEIPIDFDSETVDKLMRKAQTGSYSVTSWSMAYSNLNREKSQF